MELRDNPTLADLQTYVVSKVHERGFQDETIPAIFMLLLEELGELARAVRKTQAIKTDPNSQSNSIENEFADILFLTLELSSRLGVDLETVFRQKEKLNAKRNWK